MRETNVGQRNVDMEMYGEMTSRETRPRQRHVSENKQRDERRQMGDTREMRDVARLEKHKRDAGMMTSEIQNV